MGKWHQEEVAGDRYIFDSEANPVILGCPQGATVFVIPGEHETHAEMACIAHNAEVAALRAKLAAVLDDLDLMLTENCQCEFDSSRLVSQCTPCFWVARAKQIAEGE